MGKQDRSKVKWDIWALVMNFPTLENTQLRPMAAPMHASVID
jgi:hypothetical protein